MTTQLAEIPESSYEQRSGDLNEFDYHPVPIVAVVGFSLAVLSAAGLFIWLMLPVAALATLVSLSAVWSIARSNGVYGGKRLAWMGLLLSVAFFSGGMAYQVHAYQTEVPEGFMRVSFIRDISDKPFVQRDGMMDVHDDVKALQGKRVFLKGFIYPSGTMSGIQSFLLLKDNNQCCFGGKPALTDRLGVVMEKAAKGPLHPKGEGINYYSGRVSVAGTFELNPNFTGLDDLEPIYLIKAEYVSPARSDF